MFFKKKDITFDYINEEKVKDMCQYALDLRDKKIKEEVHYRLLDDSPLVQLSHLLYCHACRENGYTSLPTYVSDEDYDRINVENFYRGDTKKKYNASLVSANKYHLGHSWSGSGISSTKHYDFALHYAQDDVDNVIKFKLAPDTKIISSKQLIHFMVNKGKEPNGKQDESPEMRELFDYFDSFKSSDRDFLIEIFNSNHSLYAIALDYDAVENSFEPWSGTNLTILNRSKMIVSESELKRILSKCPKAKIDAPSEELESVNAWKNAKIAIF